METDPANIDGISPEIVNTVPWIRDAMEGAGNMIAAGVSVETVIIAIVAVPVLLRIINLVEVYVKTHNEDLRETIRITALEERLKLRVKYPDQFDAEAHLQAVERLEKEGL
jgi:hypothetical protein